MLVQGETSEREKATDVMLKYDRCKNDGELRCRSQ